MGPGYFPRILGILLIVLGAILALRAFKLTGRAAPGWRWRPMLIVLGSVVSSALIVNHVGPRAVDDPADRAWRAPRATSSGRRKR